VIRATALNLMWIIPTTILSGAPLWVCVGLPLFAVAFALAAL
jgi:hypothetical protein